MFNECIFFIKTKSTALNSDRYLIQYIELNINEIKNAQNTSINEKTRNLQIFNQKGCSQVAQLLSQMSYENRYCKFFIKAALIIL